MNHVVSYFSKQIKTNIDALKMKAEGGQMLIGLLNGLKGKCKNED